MGRSPKSEGQPSIYSSFLREKTESCPQRPGRSLRLEDSSQPALKSHLSQEQEAEEKLINTKWKSLAVSLLLWEAGSLSSHWAEPQLPAEQLAQVWGDYGGAFPSKHDTWDQCLFQTLNFFTNHHTTQYSGNAFIENILKYLTKVLYNNKNKSKIQLVNTRRFGPQGHPLSVRDFEGQGEQMGFYMRIKHRLNRQCSSQTNLGVPQFGSHSSKGSVTLLV